MTVHIPTSTRDALSAEVYLRFDSASHAVIENTETQSNDLPITTMHMVAAIIR